MGILYSDKLILRPESIDAFVGRGIIDAAEHTGFSLKKEFKSYFDAPGSKTKKIEEHVSNGNPAAYLIYMVSESFKKGIENNREIGRAHV